MEVSEIKKMEIIGIQEMDFNCHICNTSSSVKYEVQINDVKDASVPFCLICHNKIAKQLASQNKKRRYK
ncbi:MAG: hypothetical protein K9L78_00525 [Victivallales bacterium]|nr:hypothetical protein [Victivallales bacterium]MCF7888580.1 hypothetical protein [Victivallales bacterium]